MFIRFSVLLSAYLLLLSSIFFPSGELNTATAKTWMMIGQILSINILDKVTQHVFFRNKTHMLICLLGWLQRQHQVTSRREYRFRMFYLR